MHCYCTCVTHTALTTHTSSHCAAAIGCHQNQPTSSSERQYNENVRQFMKHKAPKTQARSSLTRQFRPTPTQTEMPLVLCVALWTDMVCQACGEDWYDSTIPHAQAFARWLAVHLQLTHSSPTILLQEASAIRVVLGVGVYFAAFEAMLNTRYNNITHARTLPYLLLLLHLHAACCIPPISPNRASPTAC